MNQPAIVSIILPTYNRSALLSRAIASCLAQTEVRFELIVVDDGSTDLTRTVVEGFAAVDARVRYIHQDNAKLPAALNTGHRAARGEFLTWTSDDNEFEPEALAIMLEALEQQPSADLVYCDVRRIGAEGEDLGVWHLPEPDAPLDRLSFGACFLYRRKVWEVVGEYSPDLFLAEDYDYWLRTARQCRVLHLKNVAPYRYRWHPQSLTQAREIDVLLQAARVRARNCGSGADARKYLAAGNFEAAYGLRRRRAWAQAYRYLTRAMLLWPFSPRTYRCLLGLTWDMARNWRAPGP